jgi:hypothetical protein
VPKPDRAYHRIHHLLYRQLAASQAIGRELTRSASEVFNRSLTEQTWFTGVVRAAFRLQLRRQVRDPELRARLTPQSRRIGSRLI